MSEGIARRDFLKSSAAGLGSFFSLSANDLKPEKKEDRIPGGKRFIYRTLGKTGIKVPAINMGVMNTDNPNLVRAALQAGMVMLDTAQTYQRGQNEAMIGEVLKGRPRDSFILATKARLRVDPKTGLHVAQEATEEAYTKKIDSSLKNLGLDHIDIYYHHGVSRKEAALYEPILRALDRAKKAGKIRFIGITTHSHEPEVIRAAADSKFYEFVLTAYHFKQKHYEEVRQAIAYAAQAGLVIVGMKPLGGKQLTESGKESINPVAALKWVLQDPNVHTVVTGFTTFDQMELDLTAMQNPALTPSEKSSLLRGLSFAGLYCNGCDQCRGACRQQLPIPDLMRAYMYVYGYRNLGEAQDLILSLNLPAQVCGDCSSCPVVCVNGFPVGQRIRNVARLREVPPEFIA